MHTTVGIVIQTSHLHVGHPNHCTQSKTLVILDSNTQAAVVGRLWGAQMMNVFRSAIFWKYICTMLLYLLFFSTILLFCGGIVPPCGGLWVHMPPHFQCLCNTIPQDFVHHSSSTRSEDWQLHVSVANYTNTGDDCFIPKSKKWHKFNV